ncbi:PTS lactose/cellobiose transporter subunit IIA [Lactiplantibacillus plantarum]|nr:PTS lactose/cellobiose transporter subunit IIA [Lactiplantibacillus plantarum]
MIAVIWGNGATMKITVNTSVYDWSKSRKSKEKGVDMQKNMEHTLNLTMTMILKIGSARSMIAAALAEIAAYRYEAAREKLRQAETELLTAQRLQVRRLIENAKAQRFVHSTLFMNAQSALVNVMGELQMTENLIGAFERWEPEAA